MGMLEGMGVGVGDAAVFGVVQPEAKLRDMPKTTNREATIKRVFK